MAKTIKINETACVRVSEHFNGFYTQLIYNGGDNSGEIFIYKSEKRAIKKAHKIKANY